MQKIFLLTLLSIGLFSCSSDKDSDTEQLKKTNVFSEDMVVISRSSGGNEIKNANYNVSKGLQYKGLIVKDCTPSPTPDCLPEIVITVPSKPLNENQITIFDIVSEYEKKGYTVAKNILDDRAIYQFSNNEETKYHVFKW